MSADKVRRRKFKSEYDKLFSNSIREEQLEDFVVLCSSTSHNTSSHEIDVCEEKLSATGSTMDYHLLLPSLERNHTFDKPDNCSPTCDAQPPSYGSDDTRDKVNECSGRDQVFLVESEGEGTDNLDTFDAGTDSLDLSYESASKEEISVSECDNLNVLANVESDKGQVLDAIKEKNKDSFKSEIVFWALKHNITHSALDDLMEALRNFGHTDLPKSAKPLLKTPRSTSVCMKNLGQGKFWYRGLLNAMRSHLHEKYLLDEVKDNVITIDIFTDGISPFKNAQKCNMCLWPLAGRLHGKDTKPFIIALWYGGAKDPGSAQEFFEDFVVESKELMAGFQLYGVQYRLKINNFIADAPARAWAKQVNQHGCYFCCKRCTIKGSWNGRVVYDPVESAPVRTDDSFKSRAQPEYHHATSPLEEILGMITQFPLDRMHLIDLGVMKRILQKMLLLPRASSMGIKPSLLAELNNLILFSSEFFPSEFSRKPRPWSDWKSFKATDFRRILHYDGFLIFRRFADIDCNYNGVHKCFLLIACACRILSDPDHCKIHLNDANNLLNMFVKYSAEVFGPIFVVYNVHHLTHIAHDCSLHGTLDDFSGYIYESDLGHLKKMIRAPGRALSEIAARVLEKEAAQTMCGNTSDPVDDSVSLSQPHNLGPLNFLSGQQFRKIQTTDFMIRLYSSNDKCCLTTDGEVFLIENIVEQADCSYFVGRVFQEKSNFFTYPFELKFLGIFEVESLGALCHCALENISRKCVLLPLFPE